MWHFIKYGSQFVMQKNDHSYFVKNILGWLYLKHDEWDDRVHSLVGPLARINPNIFSDTVKSVVFIKARL